MNQSPFLSGGSSTRESGRDRGASQARLSALGQRLLGEFREAERSRTLYVERWIEDLRQYKGVYNPHVAARLRRNKRSSVYHRMTTAKVNTMVARLMDLLFPQRTKNWSIEPTPDPMLPDDVIAEALAPEINAQAREILGARMQELAAQRIVPDQLAMGKLQQAAFQAALQRANTPEARVRIAKDRAAAMESVIDDQLKEGNANGQRRPSWQQNCRTVVKNAVLYGMGVLKGPLVDRVQTTRYTAGTDERGNVSWSEQPYSDDLRPYHEAVRIWDVFPDPDARNPQELRYVWQAHLFTDKDLKDLARFPGFTGEAINAYMRQHEDGDATLESWESQLRELDSANVTPCTLAKRFRALERWGFLSGRELADAGVDIPEEDFSSVYSGNVWILGDGTVIKAVVNPLEGVDIPYFWYPFQEDDTSFWPEGMAALLRAPQAGANAVVRAAQDNVAASSSPVYGINVQALAPGEDVQEMIAGHTFLFDKSGVTLPNVFQAASVPSCIEHNLALFTFWQNSADEISTPRFNAGDGNVAGAGKTASGLSMLMGASNILLKDHIKDFDDCIVAPFIRAMFKWNMKWNARTDIKGDFEVVASGSQSLIAKEVRAQQIPALINYLGIPAFADYLEPKALLEVSLEQTDLPAERIMRTEDEAAQYRRDRAMEQAQAQTEAIIQQLQSQGMTPEQISQRMLLLLAQISQPQPALQPWPSAPPAQQSGGPQ